MKKNVLKVEEARSFDNGIRFYSKQHKGYVAVAEINEEGFLETDWTTIKSLKKKKSRAEKLENRLVAKTIAIMIPLIITLVVGLFWLSSINPIYGLRFMLLGYPVLLIGSFMLSTSMRGKNCFKFHAAEHMVLNAYRKLNRVPTLEEIRDYSPFSKNCGSNGVTQIILSFLLIFVATFIPNPLLMALCGTTSSLVVMLFIQLGKLNFLQYFTTEPPTAKELYVAIEGFIVWLENEKMPKEHSKIFKFFQRFF